MSKITLNIVEPGSPIPAPVDPGIDPSVPNTGLFTNGIGGPEATIILSVVLILAIAGIAIATYMYRKHKKAGKATKLVRIVEQCKTVIKSKKRTTAGLAAISLLVSACTFTAFMLNSNKSNTNAIEGEESVENNSDLIANTSDTDFTIEVGDEPVFAVLPVEVTVEEATQAGYTLTAYTDSTDLVSNTSPDNKIPMVAVEGDELVVLKDNTYGLSLEEPISKDEEVYTTLSTDQDNPTIIKSMAEYSPTEAEDKTTIYYGFYVTPDTPYGTYIGTSINYEAEPHYITNLSFNGNGSDGGTGIEGMTIIAGDTITLPENTYTKEGYNFTGWNTNQEGTGDSYADEAEFTASLDKSEDVILYAQWKKNAPYMQDVASWGSDLEIGDEITVKDRRDDKEYTVARLADGNIWMTQNLDFNITNNGTGLDSTNTDVPDDWEDAGKLANTYATSTTTWNSSYATPESYDPGILYWNGALIYNQETCEENDGTWQPWGSCSGANPTSSTGDSHYHIGNYYNWTAAVAMSDSSAYVTDQRDAGQSICPAGWRLPTYSGDKSYENLANIQSITAGVSGNIQKDPAYFAYAGSWRGSFYQVGILGYYWSDIAESDNEAYLLRFDAGNGGLSPKYDVDKEYGNSLRCVAR